MVPVLSAHRLNLKPRHVITCLFKVRRTFYNSHSPSSRYMVSAVRGRWEFVSLRSSVEEQPGEEAAGATSHFMVTKCYRGRRNKAG